MKIIESFTGFQPLEEVWIGGTYPAKFYQHLPNEVEDTFCKITEKTITGFNNLEKILQKLGVKTHKPIFNQSIDHYLDNFGNLIKPPIAPRDWTITLGNELWIIPQGYKTEPYADVINEYIQNGEKVEIIDRSKDSRAWLGFPGIVRVGKRLVIDYGYAPTAEGMQHINRAVQDLKKHYEVMTTDEGGHLDSVFCPIQKGHIFSSHWGTSEMYKHTFPDWDIFWIPKSESNRIQGNWWTEENNFNSPIFSSHIQKKAANWVGNSQETVFEANMLVVDEHNVICIAEHEQCFKKMEQLGITPHVVDFPTRHFWDGGIHCITVDIRRSGGCKNYFHE